MGKRDEQEPAMTDYKIATTNNTSTNRWSILRLITMYSLMSHWGFIGRKSEPANGLPNPWWG